MCQKKYKSGLGLLSHVEVCGLGKLEKMVICIHCKKLVSKVYLNCHLRTCHVLFDKNLKERMETLNSVRAGKNIVLGNSGRVKRASMIKAEENFKTDEDYFDPDYFIKFPVLPRKGLYNKWKNDLRNKAPAKCYFHNCDFKTENINYMKAHVNGCTAISTLPLSCLKCDFTHDDVNVIRQHILERHRHEQVTHEESDASMVSEDSDNEMSSGLDENEDGLEGEDKAERPKLKSKKVPSKDKSLVASNTSATKTPQKSVDNKYRKCKLCIIL